MSGKPMDPKRLAKLGYLVESGDWQSERASALDPMLVEVLAHADHWETRAKSVERQVSDLQGREQVAWDSSMAALERERAKTKRWRSQCPVTADDDTSAYTEELGHALCLAAGLQRVGTTNTYQTGPNGARVKLNYGADKAINDLAFVTRRPAHDILDEMATATPGGDK